MRFDRAHDRHKFAGSEFERQSVAMLALKGWRAGAQNNHSRSSGEGVSCKATNAQGRTPWAGAQAEHGMRSAGMCGQNASEQVRIRQATDLVQTVLLTETLKPLPST